MHELESDPIHILFFYLKSSLTKLLFLIGWLKKSMDKHDRKKKIEAAIEVDVNWQKLNFQLKDLHLCMLKIIVPKIAIKNFRKKRD